MAKNSPTMVIAVDAAHVYVAYISRNGNKAARVRDKLREQYKDTGLRFHCAPLSHARWERLQEGLTPSIPAETGSTHMEAVQ